MHKNSAFHAHKIPFKVDMKLNDIYDKVNEVRNEVVNINKQVVQSLRRLQMIVIGILILLGLLIVLK